MGIRDDRDELATAGWWGVVLGLPPEQEEAFIVDQGYQAHEVAGRPDPGTGPYVHYRRGEPFIRHPNEYAGDERTQVVSFPKGI